MKHRILVVDDEPLLGESLCELLKFYDYDVSYAGNGCQALEAIKQQRPELILTDLIMPEMDGLKLLEAVRKTYPDIGVILLTAYGSVESSVAALKSGAFDYITKPYKEEEITQSLKRYFERLRLEKENISLRKLNELKDKFLSLASHELNTPLMIITGYLDMLKEEERVDEQYRVYVRGAYNACTRLANIIKGMRYLTYAKSDIEMEVLELSSWLPSAVEHFQSIAAQRNQCLQLEIGESSFHILADREALQEICDNLLANAVKFTPDGGNIAVGLTLHQNEVHIFCRDDGDGIESENFEHIFDTFFTGIPLLHHHTAQNYEYRGGGIGNGLAIARHLCELQGGNIGAISRPGEGSYFWASFPLYKA